MAKKQENAKQKKNSVANVPPQMAKSYDMEKLLNKISALHGNFFLW
jgi:hypothetical protein